MKRLIPFLLLVAIPALAALDEISFARRVRCEVQNADGRSLDRLTFQQGTTPLISCDVFRNGRPIPIDATVQARVLIGSSATASVFVVATNYAATNNSYLVQLPTIGTNSASAPNGLWWYTVYFDRAGHTFWTGNGELVLEKTTSTEDGIVWQEITTSGAVSAHNTNTTAHADIRAGLANTSNWDTAYAHTTESSNTVHGGFIRVAYDWATNAYAYAGRAWAHSTNVLAQLVTETNRAAVAEAGINATATNALAVGQAGAAHAGTAHGVSDDFGFYGGVGSTSSYGGGAIGNGATAAVGGGAIGNGATADDGGAIGNGATAAGGGAIGNGAKAAVGGAIGDGAIAVGGGAVGVFSKSYDGAAIGDSAKSYDGAAIGQWAVTSNGVAAGKQAVTTTTGLGYGTPIDAIQLGTGANTNPLSLQIYSYPLMNPDGTIPLARMTLATNAAAVDAAGKYVPTSRTITVNGQVGTLDSNVVFAIPITNAAYMESSTNFVITVSNGLTWVDAGASTGFVFRFTLPGGGSTNVFLP